MSAYELVNGNSFEFLEGMPATTNPDAAWDEGGGVHAIVTDPPYGVIEFAERNVEKMRDSEGGVWRIPPSMDGNERNPLPRFTVLDEEDKQNLQAFFKKLGELAEKVLRPGGHVFIASTQLLMHYVSAGFDAAGLERRDVLVRETKTLRGGDRPKGAHDHSQFKNVSSMPRVYWEPWLLYRKPYDGKLSETLETWQTGGLRRESDDRPFTDLLPDGKTPKAEREITKNANPNANDRHPSVKPQKLMRELCHASLPLQEGVILDPFMGSGSTVAAAEALGYDSIGIEIDETYYEMAKDAIPEFVNIRTSVEDREDVQSYKQGRGGTSLADFSTSE